MKKMEGKRKSGSAPKSYAKRSMMNEESFYNDGASSVNGSAVVAKKGVPTANKNVEDVDDDISCGNAFGAEMAKLLEGFSSKMNQTLQAKRQKVKKYTEESTSATVKKMIETCKNQSVERRSVVEEFRKQMVNIMDNIEMNLKQEKEFCDKSQKVLAAQQKQLSVNAANRNQQAQRMKEIAAQFFQGMDELEVAHIQQCSQVHNDMSKQMAKMQKKILEEDRQLQIMQVRKNLQNMMFN